MAEIDIAKRRAMYLLGGKDYSRAELIEKLKKNYSEKTASEVADLMCEYGYVDDEKYAAKLARKYIEVSGYGKSRAAIMMKQKGIPQELAEQALSAYSKEDISHEIANLIRKKYMDRIFLDGIEGKKEMQKVVAALARRGYGFGDIKSALYIVEEELEEADE